MAPKIGLKRFGGYEKHMPGHTYMYIHMYVAVQFYPWFKTHYHTYNYTQKQRK